MPACPPCINSPLATISPIRLLLLLSYAVRADVYAFDMVIGLPPGQIAESVRSFRSDWDFIKVNLI